MLHVCLSALANLGYTARSGLMTDIDLNMWRGHVGTEIGWVADLTSSMFSLIASASLPKERSTKVTAKARSATPKGIRTGGMRRLKGSLGKTRETTLDMASLIRPPYKFIVRRQLAPLGAILRGMRFFRPSPRWLPLLSTCKAIAAFLSTDTRPSECSHSVRYTT